MTVIVFATQCAGSSSPGTGAAAALAGCSGLRCTRLPGCAAGLSSYGTGLVVLRMWGPPGPGSNPCLLHWRRFFIPLSYQESLMTVLWEFCWGAFLSPAEFSYPIHASQVSLHGRCGGPGAGSASSAFRRPAGLSVQMQSLTGPGPQGLRMAICLLF